jgi:uncharacterized protein YlxW (UPF0749 family)
MTYPPDEDRDRPSTVDDYGEGFVSREDADQAAEEEHEESFAAAVDHGEAYESHSWQDNEPHHEDPVYWHDGHTSSTEAEPTSVPEPAPSAEPGSAASGEGEVERTRRKRISGAGLVIGLLLALLGFTLVVQVKSNNTDAIYASAREGDLLQIMSDLDASEKRLQQEIASLQQTQRELQSGAAGQEAALNEAKARADDLGILAGTLPARGPGVSVRIEEVSGTIKAASLLNAVQELRGGGAEAIQIDGNGGSVRVIASTSFVDADGGIRIDGKRLTAPYTILAIGEPETLSKAVQFAGGVVPRVKSDGGNVIVNNRDVVEIKEVRPAPDLQYATPAS